MALTVDSLKSTSPLFQYSENDIKEILKTHEKTPNDLLEDVEIIKNWLKTQPHIPCHPSDRQIASFLVNNKCSIEKTKQKIDMSFTIRSLYPEFFKNMYPKSNRVNECFSYVNMICHPKLTKDLNRAIIVKYLPGNEVLDSETILGLTFMHIEMMSLVDFVNGFELIIDLTHFALAAKFTPTVFKKFIQIIEHVYSGRLKAMRLINMPKVFEYLVEILKTVFKAKLQNRLEFFRGYEKLKEIYGENFLPTDFEGTGDSIEKLQAENREFLETYNDYFVKLQNVKVDETLRPEKLENDEFLGYYGNFKKISID